ncbi:Uma2 family endonuclease [Streptomyces sp. SID11385]|uniref:Uma2 family endonuclease n=1 Tax=Streptomyces sp. SID11385 TaxID=2706031 RepID=UPI0013C6B17E|nr:Uma2 family endonuclease [Streptomyces sp. SID11385]NEA42611.1 Uma2 family endonuclease [Streptomyces sp. SID11385]
MPLRSPYALFAATEAPEGYRGELLAGEIVWTGGEDLVHNTIVESVTDQVPRPPWRRLSRQLVRPAGCPDSAPRPDVLVGAGDFTDHDGLALPASVVELVVEVVSRTSIDRDYGVKRSLYAAAKIPAYLIIDPMAARCLLLTEPSGEGDKADYEVERAREFGQPVPLAVLGDVEIATGEFGTLPPVRLHRRP